MGTKVKQLQPNVNQVVKDESFKEELIKREPQKDSPFTIISVEGYHFGALGEYRITEKVQDKVKLRKDLKRFTWNRLIQVIMILDSQKERLAEINNKIKDKV